ncbi:MAG: SHOCT domain-containing protein [Actinobacteria bacterium]|nr:SHOCT domain-containing protein [Actinomycetota bacterium]
MSTGRLAARVAIVVSIGTLVVSIAGFVVSLLLNVFVLDKFNAYGEVPIPGRSTLQLPAGEVTISFHTFTTGQPGGGFPIPPLQLTIVPPDGAPEPELTESIGGTTTVNSDVRVRVWVAQIPQDGAYDIVTDGNVNGYINPRLAFGHDASMGWLVWLFAGLFVLSVLGLLGAVFWSISAGRRAEPVAEAPPTADVLTFGAPPSPGYIPTDQGIRLEQLKTLAALRNSGALTEEEFEAEKRRILEGY